MDDNLTIPLSYISQYNYCKRRAALLMIERLWDENSYTAMGRNEHDRVHTPAADHKSDCIVVTDMPVFSGKMLLFGKCDAVEMYEDENGCVISFLDNKKFIPYPIEYKHGVLRNETEYELQLCAQAMCIEEMFDCHIDKGAVFILPRTGGAKCFLTKKKEKRFMKRRSSS